MLIGSGAFERGTVALLLLVGLGLSAGTAEAKLPYTVKVDCGKGEAIGKVLDKADKQKPLVVVVQGTCNENVTIIRDDVTIRGEGATVIGSDPTRATIFLDGARRIVLDNLSVTGAQDGIFGNRGATFDLRNCSVRSGRIGVVAANGGTAAVDTCDIGPNGQNGILAANSAQLSLTNSTVHDSGREGVVAVRNAHIRVGQDLLASTVGPVTIRANGGAGLVVTENSAGILIASTLENNAGNGVFVGRGSNAQVGVGSLGVLGPNTIQNNGGTGVGVFQASQALINGNTIQLNAGDGVFAEGSSITVISNTILSNGVKGVEVTNSGNARIGVSDSNQPGPNVIRSHAYEGIQITNSAAAFMLGNTIESNGLPTGRPGVGIYRATGRLVGDNTIQGNGGNGVEVVQGALFQGKGDFFNLAPGPDTIQGNPRSGIFAFNGATLDIQNAIVSGNSQNGIALNTHSVLRIFNSTVSGNVQNGIRLEFDSAVVFFGPPGSLPASVTGNGGFAVSCGAAESSLAGDTSGVPAGGIEATCTGF